MLAHEEAAEHYARALEVQERFRARRCGAALRAAAQPGGGAGPRRRAPAGGGHVPRGGDDRCRPGRHARRWLAPRSAPRAATSSRPGVVDEQLIEMLEQALELTAGAADGHARGAARPPVRRALLHRSARADAGAGAGGERDRRRARRPRGAGAGRGGAPAGVLGSGPSRAATRRRDRAADAGRGGRRPRARAPGPRLAGGRPARARGRGGGRRSQIEAFAAGAERLRQPLYLWNAAVWRAMQALLGGRLDDAERLAGEALAVGAAGETVTAPQYYAIQLLAIRREQARMARARASGPADGRGQPRAGGVAGGARDAAGRDRPRRRGPRRARRPRRAPGFDAIPADGDWLSAIALLADAVADLGDADAAAELLALLEPYRRRQRGDRPGRGVPRVGGAAPRAAWPPPPGTRDVAAGHFERALGGRGAPRGPGRAWPTPASTTPGCSARAIPGRRSWSRRRSTTPRAWGCRRCSAARARSPGERTGVIGALGAGATLPKPMTKTLVIAEKPSVGRDLTRVLTGAVHQARGLPRRARAHRHLGRRPPRAARRSRRVRGTLQEVADGRPADRPGALQARRPRRALQEADERGQAAARLGRGRAGRQRLRRRPRGRADLRLPVREGGLQEAGPAPVAELDDHPGDQGRVRHAAPRRRAGLARGRRPLALGGRLDRRA